MHQQAICPFCNLEASRIILSSAYAIATYDIYPVSPGHCLIIPKRHITSFFDATREEQATLLSLLVEMQKILVNEYNPDGFNVGINVGEAAGQTVMHLHIHLIPRYAGDQSDPRGGVRRIFPDKAAYWK
jgi:diadenosine tetraphosphate (Ap4A) HIT family hydrolase